MVFAPFFLAFGAFGGGLFVASPCAGCFAFVRGGVSVCGGARAVGFVQSVLGVCAGPALRPQSYAAVSVSVWPRRLLGRQRRWRRCGAALRRCAAAGGPRGAVRFCVSCGISRLTACARPFSTL